MCENVLSACGTGCIHTSQGGQIAGREGQIKISVRDRIYGSINIQLLLLYMYLLPV